MLRPPVPSRPSATARTTGAILLLLLGLVLGVLPPPAARAAEASKDPLALSIDSLDAATVDGKGPILVSGTLTNLDDTTWHDVNVYPFVGDQAITTDRDLSDQIALPDHSVVGRRVLSDGHFAKIPSVAAGETVAWSFTVPRSTLRAQMGSQEPGVYWFGVHALGPTAEGTTATADGRARTFLPLIPKQRPSADPEKVAVVLPIRRRVLHQPDGRIANMPRWTRDLGEDGRLGRLVSFASTSTRVSYLLDPAVLDAVRQLAAGNPARSLAPTTGGDDGASASASASPGDESSPSGDATPSDDDSDATGSDPEDASDVADTKAAAEAASAWLARLKSTLPGREVLSLPYADPDLPALASHAPRLYAGARTRADAVLDDLGIDAEPVVAPPSGYLDKGALGLLEDRPLTLVSDAMFRGGAPGSADVDGHRLVVTSSAAASGGPGPGDRWSPVALRQRIVAEASLRLASHRPVVVMLPDDWTPPGVAPAFFDGIDDESWLSMTTVSDAAADLPASSVAPDRLVYPRSERKAELGADVFDSVAALVDAGRTLDNVLSRNDDVGTTVLAEALTSTSYAARRGHGAAAERSWREITDTLDEIGVEAPPSVTLSSNRGPFSVTVSNGLDEPVTVRLHASSDPGMSVTGPSEVQVGPQARSTVLLSAHATRNGVHSIRLSLTDAHGTDVGAGAVLPIRSAQVSTIIWWFIGVGCALLLVAITVRLVRRVRRRGRDTSEAA